MGGMAKFKHKGGFGHKGIGGTSMRSLTFQIPKMGRTHLSERASFPQQVQRICIKNPIDAFR
jgi:hypothetical protein